MNRTLPCRGSGEQRVKLKSSGWAENLLSLTAREIEATVWLNSPKQFAAVSNDMHAWTRA